MTKWRRRRRVEVAGEELGGHRQKIKKEVLCSCPGPGCCCLRTYSASPILTDAQSPPSFSLVHPLHAAADAGTGKHRNTACSRRSSAELPAWKKTAEEVETPNELCVGDVVRARCGWLLWFCWLQARVTRCWLSRRW